MSSNKNHNEGLFGVFIDVEGMYSKFERGVKNCMLTCCIPYDCQAAYCYSVGKLAHYNPGISVWFYYNY